MRKGFFPSIFAEFVKKNSVRNGKKSFILLLGSANLVTLRNWGLMVSRTLGWTFINNENCDLLTHLIQFSVFVIFKLYRVNMSTQTAKWTSTSGQQLYLRSRLRTSEEKGFEGERGLWLVCEWNPELPWEGSLGVHTTTDNAPYRQDQVHFPFGNKDKTEIQMRMRGYCAMTNNISQTCITLWHTESTKAQVTPP